MKYAKLGRTGLDCSRLAFGTWQIGGARWKGLGKAESVALLRHALEVGVNLFDAAVVYGQYRGEVNEQRSYSLELLGAAFQGGLRSQAIICLKLGQVDEYSHRAVFEPHKMVEELRRALRELRTDFVDICLVHAPSLQEVLDGRALSVVQTIQAMGAARFVGYSFEAEEELARLALMQNVDVIMLQFNLIDRECEAVFETARRRGIGMMIGGPFKRGYLSGRFESIADLPLEDDYWKWNVNYAREKVEENLSKATILRNEAGGPRQLRQKALEFILNHPGASCAVVGHRSMGEVTENTLAVDELSEEEVAK